MERFWGGRRCDERWVDVGFGLDLVFLFLIMFRDFWGFEFILEGVKYKIRKRVYYGRRRWVLYLMKLLCYRFRRKFGDNFVKFFCFLVGEILKELICGGYVIS